MGLLTASILQGNVGQGSGGGETPPPPDPTGIYQFIQGGNSLGVSYIDGSNTTSTQGLGNVVYNALKADAPDTYPYYNNVAAGGRHTSGMVSTLPTEVQPILNSNADKIIIAAIEGTNDIASGMTGEQAYNGMMDFVTQALALDPRICVMVYMSPNWSPSYGGATVNDRRVDYNNRLAALTQTARLKVVDIRNEPLLNDAAAWQNTTYYGDGVHLTVAGYALLGALGIPVAEII